jgi:hypothetical protein
VLLILKKDFVDVYIFDRGISMGKNRWIKGHRQNASAQPMGVACLRNAHKKSPEQEHRA